MHTKYTTLLFISFGLFCFAACKKEEPPIEVPKTYSITLNNQWDVLQYRFAAFLSNEEGTVVGFRWLNAKDTTGLVLTNPDQEKYDCTIARMALLETSSGIDTTLELTTYHQAPKGSVINLQNLNFQRYTNLKVQFTNLTSLDTLIVPDGLTFVKPTTNTNFFGHFLVAHTGRMWLRLKSNGDPNWRYLFFENINSETVNVTVDPAVLPVFFDEPPSVALPFVAEWFYNLQGIINLENKEFLPLGDINRAPGGAIPVLDKIAVFTPPQIAFAGYRLQSEGRESTSNGYTYTCDRIFQTLPSTVEVPDFDLTPTFLSDQRNVAVICDGVFDALTIRRTNQTRPHLIWTTTVPPVVNGMVLNRLPDIPVELGAVFPALKRYEFGGNVTVRAERYDLLNTFGDVQQKMFAGDDPLWQAKAGFLGLSRVF